MSIKCNLCRGTGENRTGVRMRVNNDLCPRCGGYGTIPDSSENPAQLDKRDWEYIVGNGGESP